MIFSWETTTLNIGFDTPLDVVEQLKTRLKGYISDNNREWSDVVVNIDKIENQNAIYLNISVQRESSYSLSYTLPVSFLALLFIILFVIHHPYYYFYSIVLKC